MPRASPAHRLAFGAQALRARLNLSTRSKWACYLPDGLRPEGVQPPTYGTKEAVPVDSDCTSCSTGSDNRTKRASRSGYEPLGIPVLGQVWRLSQDANGCREVQYAMEQTSDDDALLTIMLELEPHAWDAMRCPFANHVLQKGITLLRPSALQFIIDVIVKGNLSAAAARHKYACRIVQRLVEHCCPHQVAPIISAIITEASSVACNPYGNYVIQHLLDHGSESQQVLLHEEVLSDIRSVSADHYGSAVVNAILGCGRHVQLRQKLAQAFLEDVTLLVSLVCSRHGGNSVRLLLDILVVEDRNKILSLLSTAAPSLNKSRYGRAAANSLGIDVGTCIVPVGGAAGGA
jgi:hypothetical protein